MQTVEVNLRPQSLCYIQLRGLMVRADLRSSSIDLEIDEAVRFPAVWEGITRFTQGRWSRDAMSYSKFGGSAAHTGVILPIGTHSMRWVITFPGDEEALTESVPLNVL